MPDSVKPSAGERGRSLSGSPPLPGTQVPRVSGVQGSPTTSTTTRNLPNWLGELNFPQGVARFRFNVRPLSVFHGFTATQKADCPAAKADCPWLSQ
eukprot:978479-Rhodomonas_salina.1